MKVKKINRKLKICAWLFITAAVIALISIIHVLVTGEVTIFGHVINELIIILDSLFLAFLVGRASVTLKDEEKENE